MGGRGGCECATLLTPKGIMMDGGPNSERRRRRLVRPLRESTASSGRPILFFYFVIHLKGATACHLRPLSMRTRITLVFCMN